MELAQKATWPFTISIFSKWYANHTSEVITEDLFFKIRKTRYMEEKEEMYVENPEEKTWEMLKPAHRTKL